MSSPPAPRRRTAPELGCQRSPFPDPDHPAADSSALRHRELGWGAVSGPFDARAGRTVVPPADGSPRCLGTRSRRARGGDHEGRPRFALPRPASMPRTCARAPRASVRRAPLVAGCMTTLRQLGSRSGTGVPTTSTDVTPVPPGGASRLQRLALEALTSRGGAGHRPGPTSSTMWSSIDLPELARPMISVITTTRT